jgi:hypothetical protein
MSPNSSASSAATQSLSTSRHDSAASVVFDQRGWLRRMDVNLRARYPNLVTRLFEVALNRFVIVFDKSLQDADAIREEFERIRFATLAVTISNETPSKILREIKPIADRDLGRGYEGLPLSIPDLVNLLAARFPDVPIVAVRDGGTPMKVTVQLGHEIDDAARKEVEVFCTALAIPVPFELIVSEAPVATGTFPGNDVFRIQATRLRRHVPSFARRDEAFWFENLDRVYAGSMPPEKFPGLESDQARCFVDLTVGEHLNLRQAIMLYDTVYCALPLAEEQQRFLAQQGLTEHDLLFLVERGYLKIVSTQAEERLDEKFLEKVTELNPAAVLGRRTTAALVLADIVQTAEEYRLNDEKLWAETGELTRIIADHVKLPADELLRFVLWPLQARRAALFPLLNRGTKGILNIGLGPFVSENIKRLVNKDVELQTLILSERVHLGHALNATVIPARNEPTGHAVLMNVVGDGLNFFRSFNTRIAAAWVGNEERKAEGVSIMPPIPLFEFESDIPMDEFVNAVGFTSTRAKGRALFGRLAEMSMEERDEEIRRLSKELRRHASERGSLISFENLDTTASIAGLIFGIPFPPVAGLKAIVLQLRELARKNKLVDRLVQALEADTLQTFGKNQDLDFLSRISRVASFKKSRLS